MEPGQEGDRKMRTPWGVSDHIKERCLVALTFPTAFPAEAVKAAQATFDGWIAPKLGRAAIAKAEG